MKKMNAQSVKMDVAMFDYEPLTKQFSQEISSLGSFHFGQVYPDSCDEGFTMIGRTGQEVVYVVDATDGDGEDIYGWRLIPTRESVRRVPSCAGTKVLIVND